MKFDKIIMNPPYCNGLGGKITFETISLLKDDGNCICLMPLSNYKNKSAELWRYVKTFELADPKLFVDAKITENLCICTLENKNVDKYRTYEELSLKSYDPRFKAFYEVNKPNGTFYDAGQSCANNKKIFDWNDTWVYSCRAAADGVHTEDAFDRRWNLAESRVEIDDIQKPGKDGNGRYSLCVVKFVNGDTRKSCKNLSTWFYTYGKNGLADKLLHGLRKKSGNIEPAIPQIDWETISDTPLWKEGKYDEAVLLEMHLRWNDEKDCIEEENN